jgi:pyruvate carboxylase subunit A
MFKKILIANRGEIAVRVVRACRDLGITSVAIYSSDDRDALHVKMADETYKTSSDPLQAYLNPQKIIDVALACKADAIHPGYGFLSENADFAKMVEEAGLIWIGPKSEVIAKMGDKSEARRVMIENGIPVVPGTENLNNIEEAIDFAERYKYPVILKATAGGGGRGIRVAWNEKELRSGYELCKKEALTFFKNDAVFVEKYVVNPKHIEFQMLADNYGKIIHLGERDCSIQRRHQKLLEIAPSPSMDEDLRKRMGAVAVAAAKAAGYTNAGTVEFLVDDDKNFYFMEMNTRIQVEHCVTEEITGVDLVVRQIRTAAGEILEIDQADVVMRGFAIEARINAEDVKNDFAPNPGKITGYYPALGPGVRVDSCAYKDYVIPPHYDSMVAKLIVKGASYDLAIRKLQRALGEFKVKGVKTTIPFLHKITQEKQFRKGDFDTSYLEHKLDDLMPETEVTPEELAAAIAAALASKTGL